MTLIKAPLEKILRSGDGTVSTKENLRIIGSYSLDELEQDDDYLVNEINVETPNVLMTYISSPQR